MGTQGGSRRYPCAVVLGCQDVFSNQRVYQVMPTSDTALFVYLGFHWGLGEQSLPSVQSSGALSRRIDNDISSYITKEEVVQQLSNKIELI